MLHQTDEEGSLPRAVGGRRDPLLGNLLHLHVSHRCSTIKAANGFAFAASGGGEWDWDWDASGLMPLRFGFSFSSSYGFEGIRIGTNH